MIWIKKQGIKDNLIAEVGAEEAEKIWNRAKEILKDIEAKYPDLPKGQQMHYCDFKLKVDAEPLPYWPPVFSQDNPYK